ncbi:MAG: LacI family DNA-binding transcriptional regulator, partial [Actinobacteria bacterium]|nr:LacI family DNA-binding transcriptional regulator [Actinomycetota bacterium]
MQRRKDRSRPTMREVATLSGTSLKTVSRVINGVSTVADDLAERVNAAAKTLNYHTNMTAGSLRRNGGRTRTIGLLLEDISNPFSAALHRAIEDVAKTRGVTVLAGSLDENPIEEREQAELLISRRVDGLIIVPAGMDQSYLIPEREAGTSFVFVDRPPNKFDADCVVTTNRKGAREATAHLISHGHNRIAYVGDYKTIYTGDERLAGYKDALRSAKIAINKELIFQGFASITNVKEVLNALFQSDNRPTAIFASQNLVTIGAIRALRECRIENDVALVGFDDLPMADLLTPATTLVTQDVAAMGECAAELLFRRIDGHTGVSERHVLPT